MRNVARHRPRHPDGGGNPPESKMHWMKLLGQRFSARDFDHQVAELQTRIVVLNGYTALGIPVTEAAG